MSSDLERTLRRLKPERRRRRLARRPLNELPFLDLAAELPGALLCDTTVYIDILQESFPLSSERLLRAAGIWHSAVAEAELAAASALLEPAHEGTRAVLQRIVNIVAAFPPQRTLVPDRDIWREAAVLAGMLARLQGIPKEDRRRLLNDALIFATARKHGHTVLTRNVTDFDLLQQLDPSGRVLFYRV